MNKNRFITPAPGIHCSPGDELGHEPEH
jgi:hypothetical protein